MTLDVPWGMSDDRCCKHIDCLRYGLRLVDQRRLTPAIYSFICLNFDKVPVAPRPFTPQSRGVLLTAGVSGPLADGRGQAKGQLASFLHNRQLRSSSLIDSPAKGPRDAQHLQKYRLC